MLIRKVLVALGAAGVLLAPGTAAHAAPSGQDSSYLKAAHQSNLAEIAGGHLAEQKGQSQQVKNLGARFVADHTKLDNALRQTASSLGVSLPGAPDAQQQAVAARYKAASAADFDTLFISTQMDAHAAAMAAGQKEISNGSDAQVKKAAQTAAPVIASHHSALDAAARALGVPAHIGTGTGGEAAHRLLTDPVIGLVGGGVLLMSGGALLLLRRRRVVTA
jgi:putative membrane protein